MKSSRSKISRCFAVAALLFGSFLIASPRAAFAQQDIDPTWYNPWSAPAAATTAQKSAKTVTPRTAPALKQQAKVKSATTDQKAEKVSSKRTATKVRPS